MRLNLPVVLASGSPRRRELLREILPEFEVLVSNVDEEALTVSDPYATAESLAQAKARAVLTLRPKSLVIGGDTVVAVPDENGTYVQLSKPTSIANAENMLGLLSGRTHLVITGMCVVWDGGEIVFSDSSCVTFRPIEPEEIQSYVATGETLDKAGGYAIQGGAKPFIDSIDGSISNIVGLPLEKLRLVIEGL